jgi:hypothetical protein
VRDVEGIRRSRGDRHGAGQAAGGNEAAKQDTSLAHLARVAVREYLARKKGGGGK